MDIKRKIWDLIKKRFNIRGKSFLVNGIKRKIHKTYYQKKYNTDNLISCLKELGLKKGMTVMLHSSWDEFYNYTGSPKEFIDALLLEIGEEGTLLMPAYPLHEIGKNEIFDIKRTPTGAGLVAEIFRRYPEVVRSVNMHSVCALGPNANFLTDEHQFSVTRWDEKSAYFKLSLTDAIIISIGLGKSYIPTAFHCAESILREEIPYFKQFFTVEAVTKFKFENGTVKNIEELTSSKTFARLHTKRSTRYIVNKYFDKSKYNKFRISNLTMNSYDANYLINKMIELGRQGRTVYVKPDPKKMH